MSTLYFNGFETGDFSQCNASSGGATVQTSVKSSGAYGLKLQGVVGTQATCTLVQVGEGLNHSTLYLRWRMRVDLTTAPTVDQDDFGVVLYNTSGSPILQLGTVIDDAASGGGIHLKCFNIVSGAYTGTPTFVVLTSGQEYLVEYKIVIHATAGVVELSVDNVVQSAVSQSNINTGSVNIGAVQVLAKSVGNSLASVTYCDDFHFRDDAYPGAGRIYAFQGKSGAPNANAFTKTGGAAIDVVWSETPFSATNEAHSTAQNQAQTMLVAASANGGATLGGSDTINACQQVMIAKLLAGTNTRTYAMRRRISAANTDTDVTSLLTSSDTAIKGPIFTATVAEIGSAEIGATRGATTANSKELQVEDMWLMVDVTAASGRTTKNTRSSPLGTEVGMNWRGAV